MRNAIFFKQVAPFLFLYLLLIVAAFFLDFFLHKIGLLWVGRYLGTVGVITLLFSFIYSLRKRSLIKTGSLKVLLDVHEYLAFLGALMILIHTGIHFNAILPWIALIMMLVVVASGFTGKVLLKRASQQLRTTQTQLQTQGLSGVELEKKLHFDALTLELMKKWRTFHIPINIIFVVLTVLHILAILIL